MGKVKVRIVPGCHLEAYAQNQNDEVFTKEFRVLDESRLEVNTLAQLFIEIVPVPPEKEPVKFKKDN